MQPLRLCVFVAIIAVQRCEGNSKVFDFLNYLNGDYDDQEQIKEAGDDHDLIQLRIIPVDIECFRPDPVLFVEQAANHVIRLFNLAVVKDGIEDTVSLTVYNFSDSTKYKPREFNIENLSNISCRDLQRDENCNGSFRVSKDGYAFGNYPQCRFTENGKHPRFTVIHTCDNVTAAMPINAHQGFPVEPYELQLTSKKYPLINPPPDYVPPCWQLKQTTSQT